MMLNDLETRWNSLQPDPEKQIFQLYDAEHLLQFYIGRDMGGERMLLLITKERPPFMHDLRSIRLRTYKREDERWSMLLALDNEGLSSVFSLLCNDLVESSRLAKNDKGALGLVLRRLADWRKLLERGGQDVLSEVEIRGLCGELLFLKSILGSFPKIDAVRTWAGPEGGDQDFQAPNNAWEIKTIRPDAKKINIASERQLYSTSRTIELVVIELDERTENETDSFTLNDVVMDIRNLLAEDIEASDFFEARLSSANYIYRKEYDFPNFFVSSISKFDVSSEFPRITSDLLSMGISQVNYQISLNACEPFKLKEI